MYTTLSSPVAMSYSMRHNQRLQPQQGLDAEPPNVLDTRLEPSPTAKPKRIALADTR